MNNLNRLFNATEGWKKHVGSLWSQRYFSLMKKKKLSKITLNEPLEEESAT